MESGGTCLLACGELFTVSSCLLCQIASGILSPALVLPNQSSQKSQGAEERGVSTSSSPHQHADAALISLVKGSWPFHVMAHYIRAVSPFSAAKMRPLIHVSSFSLPA